MKKMDAKGSNNWNKAIKIVYGAIKEDEDGNITAGGKLIKDKGGFITHIGSDKVVRAKGEVNYFCPTEVNRASTLCHNAMHPFAVPEVIRWLLVSM